MAFSAGQLAQHVSKALAHAEGHDVLAYAWPDAWSHGDVLQVGERAVPVRFCRSPLQVREALVEPSDQPRLLLVGCEEADLGQDVLARLFRHRLLHVDRWQMVKEAFGTPQIDPRLYAVPWMPDVLLDLAPRRPTQPLAVLTYDFALDACVGRALGLSDQSVDLDSLLSAVESDPNAWNVLAEEQRALYQRHLEDKLGPVVGAVMGAARVGNAHAVLAIGLVCEILFGAATPAPTELRDARVRLEPRVGGQRMAESDGRHWAEAAVRLLKRRDDVQRHAVFRTAIELLKDLGAEAFVGESSVLPEALDRRLEALASALKTFLKKPVATAALEDAAARVLAYAGFDPGHPAPETARMVVRLCQRETGLTGGEVGFGVEDYLRHGAWEDWARRSLHTVRPDALARAVGKLMERISARRQASDRRFAEQLAQRLRLGEVPRETLPVENALLELAAPLAVERAFVVIVLDGMSWDVYVAIALEMGRSGWTPWKRDGMPPSLLATVPSVTECSRSSLLAGRLLRGASGQEKSAFAAHEALRRTSKGNRPPVLLHKAEIQEGNQLSTQAAALLSDPEQRVVGVVLNAIDDALAKSEQVRIDWSVEAIPLLGAILAQARSAGRAVLLTSDHGHVIERGTVYRGNLSENERWRPATGEVAADEIRMEGPRVTGLIGGPVIVPWSENLRYTVKKTGYHGGVTQQEMLVPVGVWTPDANPLPGFVPEFVVPPEWWAMERGDVAATAQAREAPSEQRGKTAKPKGTTDDLFAPKPEASAWIGKLLASEALKRQRERVGRLALDDDRLQPLLQCLDAQGGRASVEQLAASIQQPQLRMRGVLSVLQRMLNVDGYPVVTVESGTQTVLVDRRLLETQFDL